MIKFFKRVFLSVFLSLVCGFICGKLVYELYDSDVKKEISGKKIYLIQAGAYSTYDNMVSNTLVNNYVYYEDEGMYKAIIGITEKYDNIEKIKNSYGKDVIVSEYYSRDDNLNSKIGEFDKKIMDSSNGEEVKKNALEMLKLYKDNNNSKLVKIIS